MKWCWCGRRWLLNVGSTKHTLPGAAAICGGAWYHSVRGSTFSRAVLSELHTARDIACTDRTRPRATFRAATPRFFRVFPILFFQCNFFLFDIFILKAPFFSAEVERSVV